MYGNKISIPLTYGGWFEVLSEDGKSVKPLYSIKELVTHSANATNVKKILNNRQHLGGESSASKQPPSPVYLVRENITAYTIMSGSTKNHQSNGGTNETTKTIGQSDLKYINTPNGNLNECKKVIIKTGDKLKILSEIIIDYSLEQNQQLFQKMEKKMVKCSLERNKKNLAAAAKNKLNNNLSTTNSNNNDNNNNNLSNLTGEDGNEIVYLFEETKGKFSPIAKLENISGVHRLEDIVKKFRFPITVQLVYGNPYNPSRLEIILC